MARDKTPFGPVHASLPDGRKMRRLALALDIDREVATGHLVTMWCRALIQAPDGDLSEWRDEDVAELAGWKHGARAFVEALTLCGWMTMDRRLHEWDEYFGKFLRQRQRDAERMRAVRERKPNGSDESSRTVHEQFVDSLSERRGEERRREGSIRSADKPSADALGPQPEPKPKPPKPKKRTAEDFRALLEEPFEGYPRAWDFFKATFPAYDGKNGRMTLAQKVGVLRDWFVKAPPAKQWTTPRGIHQALARDYKDARIPWEREQQAHVNGQRFNGNPRQTVPTEDKHGNPITLPDAYVWDQHDATAWDMGKRWTGKGWAS